MSEHAALSADDDEQEWLNQGFDAYQRGLPFSARPDYASNPRRATCWDQGWCIGLEEAKDGDRPHSE